MSETIRSRVIRLARTIYAGVNHKHLTELLAERDDLVLSHPTVHRILRAAGLRSPQRRRQRREWMRRAGLLVQMDGSHHPWLQDRAPALVLLHAIDDATGTVLGAVFREREDAAGYLLLLQQLATTHGLPVAVYTDWHGIFKRATRTPLTLDEQLRGEPAPTQVGRAFAELGIHWIPANSPQATDEIVKPPATAGGGRDVRCRWTRVTPDRRAGHGDGSSAAQEALPGVSVAPPWWHPRPVVGGGVASSA